MADCGAFGVALDVPSAHAPVLLLALDGSAVDINVRDAEPGKPDQMKLGIVAAAPVRHIKDWDKIIIVHYLPRQISKHLAGAVRRAAPPGYPPPVVT